MPRQTHDYRYVVLVCHEIRAVRRFRHEGLRGNAADMRAQAAATAVGLALKLRVDLQNVRESPAAVD